MRALFLFVAVLLTGCAELGSYKVDVDALAAQDVSSYHRYFLMPGIGNHPGLEFDYYARQIEVALSQRGLERVSSPNDADVVVLFGYGVGPAQTSSYVTSIPQWGRTGYSGSQTYGTVVGNQYSSNTTYTPTYGVTGYQTVGGSLTTYPLNFFLVEATNDWSKVKSPKEIWSIQVSARSKSPDLRSAFPFMLYAAQPYIGVDTNGIKTIRVPHTLPTRTE